MEERIYGFPPVSGGDPGVLILGSMPSVRSLEYGRYYGHPRNHFWKLIFAVLELPPEIDYELRLEVLRREGIALWDVIAHCRREGSLDQAIRDPVCNDIGGFIRDHPGLCLICFNGSTAERQYYRCIDDEKISKKPAFLRLPSSSPIPTRVHKRWEDKLPEWKVIARYLEGSKK